MAKSKPKIDKHKNDIEFQRDSQDCTFTPDLSSTNKRNRQKINKSKL
jgi:hypothetical protein